MNFNHGAMRGMNGGMDIQSLLQQLMGGGNGGGFAKPAPTGGPLDGGMGAPVRNGFAKPAPMGGPQDQAMGYGAPSGAWAPFGGQPNNGQSHPWGQGSGTAGGDGGPDEAYYARQQDRNQPGLVDPNAGPSWGGQAMPRGGGAPMSAGMGGRSDMQGMLQQLMGRMGSGRAQGIRNGMAPQGGMGMPAQGGPMRGLSQGVPLSALSRRMR